MGLWTSGRKPKNDIVHYVVYGGYGGRFHYLCIRASSTTPSKRTRDVSKVTCRNCLLRLQKRELL